MRMKAKTYGINLLIANNLQLKSLPHMIWFSFLSWKIYKQGVLSYIFIFKNMAIWDESMKTT
jgi:hypothetical protein